MDSQTANGTDRSVGRRFAAGVGVAPAAALIVWLVASFAAAQGTSAATTGSGRYQSERTRDDYAAAADSDYDYAAESLRVSVWLDRDEDEIYERGDEQRVTFQTNEDAYAVVYRIDTEGLVTVLWPRDRLDDGFVFGGHDYRLPGREARALRLDEAEGEGFVEAIVSRYPFDLRALEVDFLGDEGGERYDFQVAGDPFLAMNEVNYAVTGLKDSADQVVTNYARYYVHRQVDHPRYLCAQCHDGDGRGDDPYAGHCTLVIDYDYGWANRWYAQYGYFPVYWNPVWVYVDPWTRSSWVNFWYDPWYTCAPYYDWRFSYWGCHPWYDSPYYHGGCGDRWADGGRRYHPLNRHGDEDGVRKGHEYPGVTRQVTGSGLDPAARQAMLARHSLADRAGQTPGDGRATVASRGDRPAARVPERYAATQGPGRGGALRIREGNRAGGAAGEVRGDATGRRHMAAGADRPARLAPATPTERRTDNGDRTSGARPVRRVDSPPRRDSEREGVRSLNPEQRGSRVWNSTTGRGERPAERGERPDRPVRVRPERRDDSRGETQVRPSRRDDSRSTGGAATPAPEAKPKRDDSRQQGPAASSRRDETPSRQDSQPEPSRSTPPRGTAPTRTRGGRG
jgi:hypothetical protein